MWSTHTCDDYISLTVHYINKDFEHESVCLEVAPFTGTMHTSANINKVLKHDLLHKWNIENKVNLVVCDNTANTVCAMGAANGSHFQYSTYSAIGDEPTWWSSTYLIVERLLEQQRAIIWLLPDIDLQTDLSSQDWNLLEQVYRSLKIFHVATVSISSKETTITEVIPIVKGLKRLTQTWQKRGARKEIVHSLSQWFKNMEQNKFYIIATFLDPRFKQSVFSLTSLAETAKEDLLAEIPPEDAERIELQPNQQACMKLTTTWETTPAGHCDPLAYWKTSPFHMLKKLAVKYLSAPVGSVASERLCSTAGLTFTHKRSQIDQNQLRQLVFLNKNLHFLKSLVPTSNASYIAGEPHYPCESHLLSLCRALTEVFSHHEVGHWAQATVRCSCGLRMRSIS
ncbi:hypothetical protein PR048_016134 [Dryococelus australis]|uniref:HAT C-terminal dimerisation domain-containing protein n=1 Tax=Dryococelus australis TaxID=614101 RepID=A0ABQ9HIW0_9NEOP|nr:hypothetical protein PR048_016134 [Dryococelus australis]